MQICHFLIDCLHKWQFFSLLDYALFATWIAMFNTTTFQKYLLFLIYELNEKGNKKSSETNLKSIRNCENFQNTAASKGAWQLELVM